jgi:hypothetical protein
MTRTVFLGGLAIVVLKGDWERFEMEGESTHCCIGSLLKIVACKFRHVWWGGACNSCSYRSAFAPPTTAAGRIAAFVLCNTQKVHTCVTNSKYKSIGQIITCAETFNRVPFDAYVGYSSLS